MEIVLWLVAVACHLFYMAGGSDTKHSCGMWQWRKALLWLVAATQSIIVACGSDTKHYCGIWHDPYRICATNLLVSLEIK